MKPKIFIISPTESLVTNRGQRHPNLAKYLVSNGEAVVYITSTFNHAEKKIINNQELRHGISIAEYDLRFLSVGLYKKNVSVRRVFWNIRFAIKTYSELKGSVLQNDTIIIPSRPSELLIVGLLIKMKKRTKLFLDIEDIWPDAFLISNKFVKAIFNYYCNTLNKLALKSYDSCVYVSPNFKNWINRYNPYIKSDFAPLGITSKELIPDSRKFYSSDYRDLQFFYIGTLTLQFDLLPLLKAINKTNIKYKLTLVGDNGSGERFKSTINYLEKNRMNFSNLGILSKERLNNELIKGDIVILPMISGGLPKKFFDALGSFKPVLCMGSGGAAEEINKHDLGWTSSFAIEELEKVLVTIDGKVLNQKIQNIEIHRSRYFEEKSLETIYQSLLSIQ